MTEHPRPYVYYSAFRAPADPPPSLVDAAHEAETALKEVGELEVRGVYSAVGFRPDADLAMWWVADSMDTVQTALAGFRRSALGRCLEQTYAFAGVHRPPEVAKDHVPAFLQGTPPGKYVCIYPFVRSLDWYLIDKAERGKLLREHGEMGREFPGVLANTTSGFGLGDWEWILAFESDELTEIVDCLRRLRDAEARRFTKEDTPFVTGIRKTMSEAVHDVW
ncbi:MAG TPA: hydrogen peroxide-dependent heme synthase [Actinomycetota bacterium]|nr:hydrogen peroxide-dependent heme synthase [Actinomycetota bacterium]